MKRFCWHNWSKWGEIYQTTFSNMLGYKGEGMVQTKECLKCGKIKWRRP